MDSQANWALFYKSEAGVPREFCEVRLVQSAVWVRSGAVSTWGSLTTTEFRNTEEAWAAFSRTWEQQGALCWELTRTGRHDPASFDFDLLQRELRDGARQAFAAIRSAHPDATVNGFALVTDESAMTIGPVASSEEALQKSEAGEDARWNPDEWPYVEGGEFLDIAYRLLVARQQDVPTTVSFAKFRAGALAAMVGALEELDREGLFGAGEHRERVFVLVHVTDSDESNKSVRRLNSRALASAYQKWWKSWN